MEKSQMKILGVVLLVMCAVCIFIAIERYQTNANNVRAMNQMQQNSPFGGMMNQMTGGMQMKPATPAATKYAALGALITGIAGAALLVMSGKQGETPSTVTGSEPHQGPSMDRTSVT